MGEYKVYLGNIPDDTRDRDVEKLFKGYGRIRNVVIKVSHNDNCLIDRKLIVVFQRNEQGTYGFCEFDDMRDAQDAVKDLDGSRFLGGRVKVEHARDSRAGGGSRSRGRSPMRRKGNPPGKRTGYKLIVENLSTRTSWQDLKDYMRQAGEIMYTNTHHIRSGEGIVEFGSKSDMEWAVDKLDGTELDGRKIKLIEEEGRRSRSRSKSRSRSRSRRGRDRSGSRDRRSRSKSASRGRDKSRSRSRGGSRSRSRS